MPRTGYAVAVCRPSWHNPGGMAVTQSEARELCKLLSRLYRTQMDLTGATPYLVEHGDPEYVKHHVNVFLWYSRHLPSSGAVLDWGCNHAPDASLIRTWF